MEYRDAVLDDEVDARRLAARRAGELKPALPDSIINRAVIIDALVLDGENRRALSEIDEVQELAPMTAASTTCVWAS